MSHAKEFVPRKRDNVVIAFRSLSGSKRPDGSPVTYETRDGETAERLTGRRKTDRTFFVFFFSRSVEIYDF